MIKRDEFGFIGQVGVLKDGTPNPADFDFGDCAFRTGLLAMCGSAKDKALLPKLIDPITGLVIRYPGQPERGYDLPTNTSRDQLIGWAAGVASLNEKFSNQNSDALLHYAQTGKINKDILGFDVRLFLYKCAGVQNIPLKIKTLGMAQLPLSILWACHVTPEHELNQIICQLSVFDKKWTQMLINRHPNWRRNLMNYWNGWRAMSEIYGLLLNYVEEKVL